MYYFILFYSFPLKNNISILLKTMIATTLISLHVKTLLGPLYIFYIIKNIKFLLKTMLATLNFPFITLIWVYCLCIIYLFFHLKAVLATLNSQIKTLLWVYCLSIILYYFPFKTKYFYSFCKLC